MITRISIRTSIIFTLVLNVLMSCTQGVIFTPANYKYKTVPDATAYSYDCTYLRFVIEEMVAKKLKPFQTVSYTQDVKGVFIDSVLYSPEKSKVVVLTSIKVMNRFDNSNGKESIGYYYDGKCFYGIRDSITHDIKVFRFSAWNITGAESSLEMKVLWYQYCFGRRANDHPWSDIEPTYNMDDVRFWKGEQFNMAISGEEFSQMSAH